MTAYLAPSVELSIASLRGSGKSLSESERSFFEPRFGYDFSQVRLHTGSEAEQSAREVHANAYTVGNNIVFGAGRFAPTTHEGRRIVAHELTHVLQQHVRHAQGIQRQSSVSEPDDLYPINYKYIAGMGTGDRITGRRLFEWARARGYARVVTDSTLRHMQEKAGTEDVVIDEIYLLLVERLWGNARDPETGIPEPDEFEGSFNARGRAVFELSEHWDEQVARFLRKQLASFFERETIGAFNRTPHDASLELRPDVIHRIRSNPYGHTAPTSRWGELAHVGRRYGSMHIVDIYNPRNEGGSVWFSLSDHPSWYYELSTTSFAAKDPLVAEVAAQVAENTKLAGELFPLMLKVGAFGMGMSASLAAIIASAALDELGEEGLREARGEKHRSGWEILKSASVGVFLAHVMNRVFEGGGAAGEASAGSELVAGTAAKESAGSEFVAAFEDRAAGAVRHEVAAAEVPQVTAELRAGRARPVEDKELLDEGYVAEVDVVSEGQVHTYRKKNDGTWCRFTRKMCYDGDEIPGSEWDDILEEAARQERAAVGRAGRGARETFVSKGVEYELVAKEANFAALRGAPPGAQVYVLRDTSDRVIYVGIVEQQTAGRTAIERLQEHLREKAPEFLGDASSLEVKGVGLEVRDARALEDDLITQHNPKWNNRERDPQSYLRKYGAQPLPEEVSRANNISVTFAVGFR